MGNGWQRLKAASRVLFGGDAPKAAGGLLTGVVLNGMNVRKGTKELFIAYRQLPRLHAAVHRIASDVAGVPLKLYRAPKLKRKAELAASMSTVRRTLGTQTQASTYARKMVLDARASGDLEEVGAHPFLDLYRQMNPALRGAASKKVTQIHLDLKGEAFWVLERDGAGNAIEAWPVPPHWVKETPSASHPFYRASWGGWNRQILETDVLWFRDPDPEHPYARGVGTGESLADELDVDENAAANIKAWFQNGARPEGIVAFEGIGQEDLEMTQAKWMAKHQGAQKAHQMHFTTGKLTYTEMAHTFAEMQLVELRKFEADIIRQSYGIPPEILGEIENSNRATIDAALLLYTAGVICPRMEFLCDSLEPLLAEWEEGLILDYASPVPEDREFQAKIFGQAPAGTFSLNEYRALGSMPAVEMEEEEAKPGDLYQYHFQFGIITINEARARLGLPPMKDGDKPPDLAAMFGGGMGGLGGGDQEQMAAEPAWVKDLKPIRVLPARTKDAKVENVLEALRPERIKAVLDPIWQAKVKEWGDAVLADLGIDARFDMRNPLAKAILEKHGTRITKVTETTREKIMSALEDGMASGEGIAELKTRVKSVFEEASSSRAQMIARTETVASSNQANVAAWKMSGVVEQKEWLSVRDGATREEHADLDGAVVALDGKWTIDGHSASHPGGFGVPGLDINCRCTAIPRVADLAGPAGVSKQLTEEQKAARWKAFDQGLLPWERAAVQALQKGFKQQEAEVLTALEKVLG